MGISAKVRGPARGGVSLLLQCRATKYGHKGERIQPDNKKPQGIKCHHSQRSLLGDKCRRRLSPGGSQDITKYIKYSFVSPLLSFTGYLCRTSAKDRCCYRPRVSCTHHCTHCTRPAAAQKTLPCFYSKILSGFKQNSSHLGLL